METKRANSFLTICRELKRKDRLNYDNVSTRLVLKMVDNFHDVLKDFKPLKTNVNQTI